MNIQQFNNGLNKTFLTFHSFNFGYIRFERKNTTKINTINTDL